MKDLVTLYPSKTNKDVIVQFSETVNLEKNTFVTVPSDFTAIVYINEKPSGRLDVCNEKPLLKHLGKEFSGNKVKVAFIRKNDLPSIPWGFGNINAKNDKLSQTYRVGLNGKYLLGLKDPIALIKALGSDNDIIIDDIANKTKAIIKTIGTALLSDYFANQNISIFEISSKTNELRELIFEAVKKETFFKDCGLELRLLTLEAPYVNEEDMEIIRNQINNNNNSESVDLTRISEMVKDAFDERFNEMMGSFKDLLEEERKQNSLPLYDTAKEEWLKNLDVTADLLVDKADNDSICATAASMMYSNVEYNLMHKFNIPHSGKEFYMSLDEFNECAKQCSPSFNLYPRKLDPKNPDDKNVIMPVEFRFMKVGLDTESAVQLAKEWSLMNKFRHMSDDNTRILNEVLQKKGLSKKEFLRYLLNKLKELGLYTD